MGMKCVWAFNSMTAVPTSSRINRRQTLLTVLIVFGVLLPPMLYAEGYRVEGFVRDASGAAISGAAVRIESAGHTFNTFSNTDGKFEFANIPAEAGTLVVEARGFSASHVSWNVDPDRVAKVDVLLKPAGNQQQITVSASGTRLEMSETPGSVTLLTSEDLGASPSLTVDDVLRQVPGFSLFRRSGSRVANPTTGGVSLRGLGASGASRALVLKEGIPLSDPFGGWVYWGRVPEASIGNIEIFRGGASNLYGSDALGGVIQVSERQPEESALSLSTSYGNERTPALSAWAGTAIGKWGLRGGTDLFHTDGYVLVPAEQRGTIDTRANSEHATAEIGLDRRLGSANRFFANGEYFTENRNNGTRVQANDTQLFQVSSGVDANFGPGALAVRMFGSGQSYNQSFSSIAADRNSESLTNLQHVPAQQVGGSARWSYLLAGKHTLIAGFEGQEVVGSSHEQVFVSNIHTANSVAGGHQRSLAVLGEGVFRIAQQWTVIGGLRWDDWKNFNGSSVRIPLTATGVGINNVFPDRSDDALSPRVSVLRALNENLSITASGYQAFRAPTLNELYRSFRVGNVVTQNNSQLRAERLTGGEAGINASFRDGRLVLRSTFFWSEIKDPIANATLSVTPALVTRQRQNLGRTRSRGVELDGTLKLATSLELSAGYIFTDASVVSFPRDPTVEGLAVPQVPRNAFSFELRYWNPSRLMVSFQGRYVGPQFEDDQNQLALDGFFTANVMAGRALRPGLQAFVAIENVTNQRYVVGLTPVPSLGPPILFRVGLKLDTFLRSRK
jgi:outer membrane receptor protein involved in Fe transport